jgi:hypothetical protein
VQSFPRDVLDRISSRTMTTVRVNDEPGHAGEVRSAACLNCGAPLAGPFCATCGRRYPEHLYFAIHLHAFIFLALAAAALLNFTRLPILADVAGIAVAVWILVYATRAFRYVYGGSLARTLTKEVGIAAVYGLTSLVAFIVMIYWVSIAA